VNGAPGCGWKRNESPVTSTMTLAVSASDVPSGQNCATLMVPRTSSVPLLMVPPVLISTWTKVIPHPRPQIECISGKRQNKDGRTPGWGADCSDLLVDRGRRWRRNIARLALLLDRRCGLLVLDHLPRQLGERRRRTGSLLPFRAALAAAL